MTQEELMAAIERAREASKGRVIRDVQPKHINKQIEREKHGAPMRVIHPEIGSVVVKARSPFDAQCAAEEKLGLPFLALRGCEVWGLSETRSFDSLRSLRMTEERKRRYDPRGTDQGQTGRESAHEDAGAP